MSASCAHQLPFLPPQLLLYILGPLQFSHGVIPRGQKLCSVLMGIPWWVLEGCTGTSLHLSFFLKKDMLASEYEMRWCKMQWSCSTNIPRLWFRAVTQSKTPSLINCVSFNCAINYICIYLHNDKITLMKITFIIYKMHTHVRRGTFLDKTLHFCIRRRMTTFSE